MSTFIKYPSVENSYQSKYIDAFIKYFPDLLNCKFTIENKIDGSSLTIICKPDGEIRYASRNQLIGVSPTFYGVDKVITKYLTELDYIRQIAIDYNEVIQFHCELFGSGVFARVNYGLEKQIRIYGFRINEQLQSPAFLYETLGKYNLMHLCIPVLGTANGLEEALAWNCEFQDPIFPEGNSKSEGIVIKPLNKVYVSNIGDIFYIKKKSEDFKEKETRKRLGIKHVVDLSPQLISTIEDFKSYITKSRMYGVFSKEGRNIQDMKDMAFFIIKIIEDAKNDWRKDNPDIILSSGDEKIVFNVGKNISKLLIDFMKGN